MPCKCDYMEPNARERESYKILNLLDEVGLITGPFNIYGNVSMLDKQTAMLCEFCQQNDVTKHSLELQIWWRDHQEMDKHRLERELKQERQEKDREKAISKLTDYEKKLLGL